MSYTALALDDCREANQLSQEPATNSAVMHRPYQTVPDLCQTIMNDYSSLKGFGFS